jgi:hypothetical protein
LVEIIFPNKEVKKPAVSPEKRVKIQESLTLWTDLSLKKMFFDESDNFILKLIKQRESDRKKGLSKKSRDVILKK